MEENDTPGTIFSFSFSDCGPPVYRSFIRRHAGPVLNALGVKEPRRPGYWGGTLTATRLSDHKTRIEIADRYPINDIRIAPAYMELIKKRLATQK